MQYHPKVHASFQGCLCDNWKPSFLPPLIFNCHTFSRYVTARWWCPWAKNQMLTNQISRNRCDQIVRQTIFSFNVKPKMAMDMLLPVILSQLVDSADEKPRRGKTREWISFLSLFFFLFPLYTFFGLIAFFFFRYLLLLLPHLRALSHFVLII